MITDKDIIIELLRQREDLQAKLSAINRGNFLSLPKHIQDKLNIKRSDLKKPAEEFHEALKRDYRRIAIESNNEVVDLRKKIEELKSYTEELADKVSKITAERDNLKKQYEALEYQRDDLSSVLKECNFPELKKLLNVPEGEILSTQLVKKVQELIRERDHWKSMQNMLAKKTIDLRDKYDEASKELLELRDRYDKLVDEQ